MMELSIVLATAAGVSFVLLLLRKERPRIVRGLHMLED